MGKRKRGRRGNGEGAIQKRPNGRYKAIRTLDWKTRETESQTFDSHAEAVTWLAQRQLVTEAAISDAPMLLADWVETWLSDIERTKATSTFQSYEYHLNSYVIPNLGRFPIAELKPLAFRNLLTDLENNAVGSATLQKIYSSLHSCFEEAKQMEIIQRNPVSNIPKPQHTRKKIDPFTMEEAKAILAATRHDRLHAMYVLAFHLGLRQGELYALEWEDLDFKEKTLSIERQVVSNRGKNEVKKPKTQAGIRVLDLADETLAALLDRKQLAWKELGGKMADNPLIFPGARGGYLQRSSVGHRWWKPLLKRLKIRHRGIHHCRHTFASEALANGEDLITVAATMGHANPNITLRIYGHLVQGAKRRTAERVAKLFSTTTELHPAEKRESS